MFYLPNHSDFTFRKNAYNHLITDILFRFSLSEREQTSSLECGEKKGKQGR